EAVEAAIPGPGGDRRAVDARHGEHAADIGAGRVDGVEERRADQEVRDAVVVEVAAAGQRRSEAIARVVLDRVEEETLAPDNMHDADAWRARRDVVEAVAVDVA